MTESRCRWCKDTGKIVGFHMEVYDCVDCPKLDAGEISLSWKREYDWNALIEEYEKAVKDGSHNPLIKPWNRRNYSPMGAHTPPAIKTKAQA